MTVLVTGAAGFIGMHVSAALLERGETVLGVDNLNDYYSVDLKRARLALLEDRKGFTFELLDISDGAALQTAAAEHGVDRIVHLAAQAGVRYSIENPAAYIQSNLVGHAEVLELARQTEGFRHLVYASSSSVYGGNQKLPFSVDDRVDGPVSLYAATKRADELMSHSYAHLYRVPQTGLRFFTVYGPWGRPDMAAYLFTEAILAGRPIKVFNHGDMRRDFTYIDDIVKGVVAVLDTPPADNKAAGEPGHGNLPHRVYNLGNNRTEKLTDFIAGIEQALGKKAEFEMLPMQPGDVKETYADIEASRRDFGFDPATSIDVGLPKFVEWYRSYHDA